MLRRLSRKLRSLRICKRCQNSVLLSLSVLYHRGDGNGNNSQQNNELILSGTHRAVMRLPAAAKLSMGFGAVYGAIHKSLDNGLGLLYN